MDVVQTISGSWDRWYFEWDTTEAMKYPHKQEYEIVAWASDGVFEVFDNLIVLLDQSGINHPPIVESIENIGNISIVEGEVIDLVLIEGVAYDEDWDSDTITVGKKIANVFLSISYDNSSSYVIREYVATFAEEGNGQNHWSFLWDVNEPTGRQYLFPDGRYIIRAMAMDDAGCNGTGSGVKQRMFGIYSDILPVADISFISCADETLVQESNKSKTTDAGNFRQKVLEVTDEPVVAYVENEGDGRGSVTLTLDAGSYWTEDGRIIGSHDEDGEIRNTKGSATEEWDGDLDFFWVLESEEKRITSDDIDGDSGDG